MEHTVKKFRLGVDKTPQWFFDALNAKFIRTTQLPGFNIPYDGSVIVKTYDGTETLAVPGDYILMDSLSGYYVEQGETA